MTTQRADRRLIALLITLLGVIVIGAVVTLMPRLDFTPGQRPSAKYVEPPSPKEKAEAHARAAIREEVDKRFNEAVAMLHAKKYEYAVTALHRVLELAPKMPEAHVNMGYALLGEKKYKAARDFFQSAIELRANQMNAYYGLALALRELGETEGAVGAMRTYVHLAKPNDTYRDKAWSILQELEDELRKVKNTGSGPDTGLLDTPMIPKSKKKPAQKSH